MKVCYFGIYNPEFGRNAVYISGLRQNGVEVTECRDTTSGIKKYLNLYRKLEALHNNYDVIVIGYPGHVVTPLAWLITSKRIVLDALGSLYEAEVLSHQSSLFKSIKTSIIDYLAVKCAAVVLVESEPQKEYFIKKFGGNPNKYQVLYTGASDEVRTPVNVSKSQQFTVLFRGSLTPESGLNTILEAARIIETEHPDERICFRLIGRGIEEKNVKDMIVTKKLACTTLITEWIPWPDLISKMMECHVSLGQFSNNPRLERTIPHKAYESLALGLPYITARTLGISSILRDGEECIMVTPADPQALVQAILKLKSDQALQEKLAENGKKLFDGAFTAKILGARLVELISS